MQKGFNDCEQHLLMSAGNADSQASFAAPVIAD
jgi:hypothetical protein